jgi:ABC-type sugar transport system ATPase subunit
VPIYGRRASAAPHSRAVELAGLQRPFGVRDEETLAGDQVTAAVAQPAADAPGGGACVVVISHNLENVCSVADRIVVLRLGRLAETFDRRTTPREEVVAAITGASVRA